MSPKKSSMLLPVFYWSLIFMIMTLQYRRIYSKVYFLLLHTTTTTTTTYYI